MKRERPPEPNTYSLIKVACGYADTCEITALTQSTRKEMKEFICRVAIIGAQRPRVVKVISLLEQFSSVHPNEHVTITIQYLPCIASFGTFKDETGTTVKYLSNLSYHGVDGKENASSLAPFFDEERDEQDPFIGISVAVLGCGIEDETDIQQIRTFLQTLSGECNEKKRILVDCVTPNPGYATMKDETIAYQALDVLQKEEAAHSQTIGPGKLAKFALSTAMRAIDAAFPKKLVPIQFDCHERSNESILFKEEPLQYRNIDETKTRYACRMCRRILFDNAHLEDPPHQLSKHNFGYRKYGSAKCESLFLTSGLDWMGDISAVEGKFRCPSCSTKLGVWKWAGTQCSCGTWVVPAIQVPSSKVDIVHPIQEQGLNTSYHTIMNPAVDATLNLTDKSLIIDE